MSKKYKNPPIIEALCEFRFQPSQTWDLAVPGLLYEKLRTKFPTRRQGKAIEATIATSAEAIQHQVTQVDRIQFLREDGNALVQVSPNILAVNHLKPYPSWEVFKPMIMEALETYQNIANPKGLQRIGLRYINRIEIPLGEQETEVELSDFFEFYPYIGKRLPQVIFNFRMATKTRFHDSRDILLLQLSSVLTENSDSVVFLLDLDHSLAKPNEVRLQGVSEWLEEAHERVEEDFEGSIKDRLRVLFGEVKGE